MTANLREFRICQRLTPFLACLLLLGSGPALAQIVYDIPPQLVDIAADGQCSLREAFENIGQGGAIHADCPAGAVGELHIVNLAAGSVYEIDAILEGLYIESSAVLNGNGATILRTANTTVFDSCMGDPHEFSIFDLTLDGGDFAASLLSHCGGTLRVSGSTLLDSGFGIDVFEEVGSFEIIVEDGTSFSGMGTAMVVDGNSAPLMQVTVRDTFFTGINLGVVVGRVSLEMERVVFEPPYNSTGPNLVTVNGTGLNAEATIRDSSFFGTPDTGFGVLIETNASVVVEGSTFANGTGGGILLTTTTSTAEVRNSTFSGLGLGLQALAGSATVNNATFADNQQAVVAMINGSPLVGLANTILADSLTDNCAGGGTFSTGYNLDTDGTCVNGTLDLIGVPAGLEALADNGGLTLTHALAETSAAIDAGQPGAGLPGTECETVDQRGVPRPQDGTGDDITRCDIGAVEMELVGTAAIELLKTVTSPPFYQAAGVVINYLIEATNSGDLELSAVTISDPLLGALNCNPAQPAVLAPGEVLACTGSYTTTAADASSGGVVNTATVSGQDPDAAPVSAEASATAFGPSEFNIPDGLVAVADDGQCSLVEAFLNINSGERLFDSPGECPMGSRVLNTVNLAANGDYLLVTPGQSSWLELIFEPVQINGNSATISRSASKPQLPLFEAFITPEFPVPASWSFNDLTLDGAGQQVPLLLHGSGQLLVDQSILRNAGTGIDAFNELSISLTVQATNFEELGTGLLVSGDGTTSVVVQNCRFTDNGIGADLFGTNAGFALVNTFENSQGATAGTGIRVDGNQPGSIGVTVGRFINLETGIDVLNGNLSVVRSGFHQGGTGIRLQNAGGTHSIVNSTFSGLALGLEAENGSAQLNNTTFAFNQQAITAQINGGPTVTVANSILADSSTANCAGDGLVSGGYNLDTDGTCVDDPTDLIGLNPLLGALDPTGLLFHPLQPGSPAISASLNPDTPCEEVDQRGVPRPQDGNNTGDPQCDIGAFELEGSPNPSVEFIKSISAGSPYTNPGDVITYELVATNTGNVTLENVVIDDPEVAVVSCELTQPAALEPDQSQFCSGSYVITQADVDAGFFTNTATVTGEDLFGTPVSAQDSATAFVDGALTGTCVWIGGTTGSWHVAANWDCSAHNGIPTSGDEVTIAPQGGTLVDFGADAEAWGLIIGIDDGSATHPDTHRMQTTADNVTLQLGQGGLSVLQTGFFTLGRIEAPGFFAALRATLISPVPIIVHGKLYPANATIMGEMIVDRPGVGGIAGNVQARGWNIFSSQIDVLAGSLQSVAAGIGHAGAPAPHIRVLDGDIRTSPGALLQFIANDNTFSERALVLDNGIVDNGGNITTFAFPDITVVRAMVIDAELHNSGSIRSRVIRSQGLGLLGPPGTEHINTGLIEVGALFEVDGNQEPVPGFGLTIGEGRSLRNTSQIIIHRLRSADGVVTNADGGVVSDETEVTGAGTYVLGFAGPQQVSIAVNDPGDIGLLAMDWTAADHPLAGLDPRMVGGGHWWSLAATTVDEVPGSGSLDLTLPRLVPAQTEPLVCRFADPPGEWQCLDTQVAPGSVTTTGLTTLSDWAVGNEITQVPPEPAISLTKSITSGSPYAAAGDLISYSLVATNTGDSILNQVTISDPRLGPLTCTPAQPATRQPGEALSCTGVYAVTQADVDAGSVVNTATASGLDPDGNTVSAIATAIATGPAASPAIGIDKSISAGSPYSAAGDVIEYLFEMTNLGNVTLTSAMISDPGLELLDCGGGPGPQSGPQSGPQGSPQAAAPEPVTTAARTRAQARAGPHRLQRGIHAPGTPVATSPPTTLGPGQSFSCTGTYTVSVEDLEAGSYTNTATASAFSPLGAAVIDQDSVTAIGPLLLFPFETDLGEIEIGESFSAQFNVVGAIPPYTIQVGVPEGFEAQIGATTVTIAGTGLRAGRLEFPITVSDSGLPPEQLQRVYQLRVATDLVIDPPELPDGVQDEDYYQVLRVTNGIPPFSFEAAGLPPGIELQRNILIGVPTEAGSFPVSVIAQDAQGNVGEAQYTLEIAPPDFVASGLELPDAVLNVSYSHQLFASSRATPVVWSDASGLPPGLELQYTGFITGRPTAAGTFQVGASATDAGGRSLTASAPLIVRERGVINATPDLPPGVADRPYTGPLVIFGSAAPFECDLAAGELPTGLALEGCALGVAGTPTIPGTFGFDLLVSDSDAPPSSDLGAFSIRIADPEALAEVPVLIGAPAVPVPVPDFGQGRPAPDLPDESLQQMAVDGFGNRYLVGYSYNGIHYDMLVLKYDADGQLLWSQRHDSGNHDYGYAIAINPLDQGIYVVGYSLNGNRYEGVLLSLDAAGVLRWEQRVTGGVLLDALYGVAADRERVYVTGERYNGSNFDALYAAFGHDGSPLWTGTRTAAPTQTGYAVHAGDCGQPVCPLLVGGAEGAGLSSGWLLAIDRASGTVSGQQSFGQFGVLAIAGTGGGYLVGGDTAASQWQINRLDAGLQPVWSGTFADGRRLRSLVADEDGFIYAAGRSGNGQDALLKLLGPAGQVLESRVFDTGAQDRFNSIAIGPEGLLTAAGERRESTGNRAILIYLDTGKAF